MTSFTLAFTELWRILFLYFILLFAGAIWYVSHGPFKPGDNDKTSSIQSLSSAPQPGSGGLQRGAKCVEEN